MPFVDAQRPLALVTGGNRGVGYETCLGLVRAGFNVLLGSRDLGRGRAAVGRSGLEEGLEAIELDVASSSSVDACAHLIAARFAALDVLINNAGVYLSHDGPASSLADEVLAETLETNLYGPLRTSRAMLPLLRKSKAGRIVNLSSSCASLELMMEPECHAAYSISKTALNALTRLLASENTANLKVNAMDPDWVRSDMGMASGDAPRPVTDPVETVVWLATLEADGPTGGFFRDRQPMPW